MPTERRAADREILVFETYPACPPAESVAIAEHACTKYSGRVGRTAGAKDFDPQAIDLAVRAHVRHEHTRYDELLAAGRDRWESRDEVAAEVEQALDRWRRRT